MVVLPEVVTGEIGVCKGHDTLSHASNMGRVKINVEVMVLRRLYFRACGLA